METSIHFFSWDAGRQVNTGQRKASLSMFKLKERDRDRYGMRDRETGERGEGKGDGGRETGGGFHEVLTARRLSLYEKMALRAEPALHMQCSYGQQSFCFLF